MKELRRIAGGKFTAELHMFGTGEPLLFLHGAGGLLGIDPFLEDLGHSFKVIAPHLPGYGESTGGDQIEDVFDAVLFYHQLLDELGIASSHVFGHSMGGMLAAELAAMDVHRVKKLVLVTPAGFESITWAYSHTEVVEPRRATAALVPLSGERGAETRVPPGLMSRN